MFAALRNDRGEPRHFAVRGKIAESEKKREAWRGWKPVREGVPLIADVSEEWRRVGEAFKKFPRDARTPARAKGLQIRRSNLVLRDAEERVGDSGQWSVISGDLRGGSGLRAHKPRAIYRRRNARIGLLA